MKEAIIVFQKNKALGKVKTRLAATVGDEKALELYGFMVKKMHQEVNAIGKDVFIYFSDFVDDQELSTADQTGCVQFNTPDLGVRMFRAFEEVAHLGYDKMVLIGTDCYELTHSHFQQAFDALETHDYVFGPANDGGYYLIACKQIDEEVLFDKVWSTDHVLKDALSSIEKIGKKVQLLEVLTDIDTEEELGELKRYL